MSHGEGSKRLASPRNTKDRKHLQSTQSAQPTHLTDQAPSTTERTARETHNINYHSSRARFSTATTHHHHPHPTGSSPKPFSQRSPLRSPGAIQAGCLSRRAEPHNTLDPTRLSGDTQRPHLPPPPGGAHHQEWQMASPWCLLCSAARPTCHVHWAALAERTLTMTLLCLCSHNTHQHTNPACLQHSNPARIQPLSIIMHMQQGQRNRQSPLRGVFLRVTRVWE